MAQLAPGGTPPRRTFGSASAAKPRPTSTASISSLGPSAGSPPATSSSAFVLSHTASSSISAAPAASGGPALAAPQPQRARASSAAAGTGGAAVAAAERAQQWLSSLAPRGEGRGREFLTNTLSGVATVASTVGQEINGVITRGQGQPHSRSGSFASSPPPDVLPFAPRAARRDSIQAALSNAQAQPSQGIANGNGMAGGRRPPPPANLRRLGRESAPPASADGAVAPSPSPTAAAFRHREEERRSSSASVATATAPTPRTAAHARSGSTGGAAALAAAAGLSTSPAPSAASSTSRRARGTPYKIGFQPSGVRRDRTAEYTVERKANAAEREKEEGRLSRRWAKLVDLHFNPSMQTAPGYAGGQGQGQGLTRSGSSSFSLSSIASAATARPQLNLNMDDVVDSLKPRQVWKGLKAAAGPGPEDARKRAAEQRIVKWEPDAEARKCRICAASFSLSTRKHHCRLCGRIVCSLPPTPPALLAVQMQLFAPADGAAGSAQALPPGTRREKCSLLLVADWRTGRGEEVDEGFVGWMSLDQEKEPSAIRTSKKQVAHAHARQRSASILSDTSSTTTISEEPQRTIPLPQQPQEVQVKGVRVCRECWATVSRKMKIADRARITPFARLYATLRSLQSEIAALLPGFESEIATLQSSAEDAEPSPRLLATHKTLLGLLTQYDALAKRVSAAPCDPGGSQASVQRALARSAAEFLALAAASAQELPRLQRRAAQAKARNMVVVEQRLPDVLREGGVREEAAEDVARALQPLLEQQAQLESFIAEANAQRKYDDSRSLALALGEIENEIARLTASAMDA